MEITIDRREADAAPAVKPGGAPAGLLRAAFTRARAALLPGLVFAPAYASGVVVAVALHLYWREMAFNPRTGAILILFALGALLGGFLAYVLAASVAGARPFSARLAAIAVALMAITAGITAFLFFLQFRIYYAQWHTDHIGRLWLMQMAYTGATAVYIFMSSGLKLILPFGLPVLFAASWVFARRSGR
ncbi:hypothetical protein [Rhodobium gokarnense]|uniref:Uncharacterized protein n=1 Tax=Rhodobium gokarnense TaxID=364296 RepID=A0ABT3HDB6_9HYPH|nr:hypothetical protein [Rhodobium gokarnense]MCW2308377.1 hypothetical protein [Rhodobium gokarnense]